MSDRDHRSQRKHAPLFRTCKLCGIPKAPEPISEEHLKAHMARRIAFVCLDCAARIRNEVEMAGSNPGISA